MSREIDMTKPLSDEDRDYLLARGREQQVLANDAQFSTDPDVLERALYIPGTSIDRAEGVPKTPDFDPAEAQADESDDESEDYSGDQWSKAALVAEIERRNAEYDEEYQISTAGSKQELVGRLVEDDNTE